MVEEAWQEGRDGGFLGCLHHCGEKLQRWGGDHFYKFGEKIKQLRKSQLLLRELRDPDSLAEFQRIEEQLARLEAKKMFFGNNVLNSIGCEELM